MSVIPSDINRDDVFIAGGRPTFTYVTRRAASIDERFRLGLRARGQVVSICGSSKCGKTVFCSRALQGSPFVWISAGSVTGDGSPSVSDIWKKVCYVLNYPVRINVSRSSSRTGGVKAGLGSWLSFENSMLSGSELSRTYEIDSMESAIRHLLEHRMVLVVDDYHYLPEDVRRKFARSIKSAIHDGLKVILISVPYHGLDIVKAEYDLEGRVDVVSMPEWSVDDLRQIGEKGFTALNVEYPEWVVSRLAEEAQQSPLLMQKLCSEFCIRFGIDKRFDRPTSLPDGVSLSEVFSWYAGNMGYSGFAKLEAGPATGRVRQSYNLRTGTSADIYRVLLMAIASTDSFPSIPLGALRLRIDQLVPTNPPTSAEIESAIGHFSSVSIGRDRDFIFDWLADEQLICVTDPFLRYYLRWRVRPMAEPASIIRELANPARS